MKIKQIYHIGLPCNDLERATKFYTDVLGMKCTKVGFDTESGGPYKDVYGMFPEISRLFMEDGMCLVLFQRPKPVERGDFDEGTSHIALEVSSDDFDTYLILVDPGGEQIENDDAESSDDVGHSAIDASASVTQTLHTGNARVTGGR